MKEGSYLGAVGEADVDIVKDVQLPDFFLALAEDIGGEAQRRTVVDLSDKGHHAVVLQRCEVLLHLRDDQPQDEVKLRNDDGRIDVIDNRQQCNCVDLP